MPASQDSPDALFGLANLPYGVFSFGPDERRHIGVRLGQSVLDLGQVAVAASMTDAALLAQESLDGLLAAGRDTWERVRSELTAYLSDDANAEEIEEHKNDVAAVQMHMPFTVGDYVDFYSCEAHATNLGKLFRPGSEPLTPNWKHLPIGYHGRSGTIVVSGTDFRRPSGLRLPAGESTPVFGPSVRLDVEVEVGFVVGKGSDMGSPVTVGDFADHVFGAFLVNDWSARDIQSFEYVPLGPFLGKSFATSISPWVVPLQALDGARVTPPTRDMPLANYLADVPGDPWGLDISLELELNGTVVSRPPFAGMYWTPAQQLAHMTVNGASIRTGDMYASGTVSGPEAGERGSFLELAWNGSEPVTLADGSTRSFLQDGDTVTIRASAPAADGARIGFGEVTGRLLPA